MPAIIYVIALLAAIYAPPVEAQATPTRCEFIAAELFEAVERGDITHQDAPRHPRTLRQARTPHLGINAHLSENELKYSWIGVDLPIPTGYVEYVEGECTRQPLLSQPTTPPPRRQRAILPEDRLGNRNTDSAVTRQLTVGRTQHYLLTGTESVPSSHHV